MSSRSWQYTSRGRLSTTIHQTTKEVPEPGPDEVVIQVKATALNPVEEQIAQSSDALLRFIGAPPMGTPFVPCWDFSGIIHSIGNGVSAYKKGDEVFGVVQNMGGNGTLQEYLCVPQSMPFTHKPTSLPWDQAAAIPLAYGTVYTALINYGKLPFSISPESRVGKKRSVLILGGSSGTGSIGIQLAKKMGLNVVTTCSERNRDFVKDLGADEIIDYRTENVVDRALHSHYAPYAVVLDCVGGTDLLPHLDHLVLDDPEAPELGIYITLVGDKTSRDAMGGATTNWYYPSQAIRQFRGSLQDTLPSWFPFKSFIANKRYACIMFQPTKELYDTVSEFMKSAGEVQIDSVWSFDDSMKAFEKLESGRARGKVVIKISD